MARANTRRVSFDDLASRRGLTVGDLVGLELTLEYTDADKQKSTRAVRVLQLQGDTLFCRCHWRRAERNFRIDRINAVIDQNGEVLNAAEFFGLFGVAVAPPRSFQPAYDDGRVVNTMASKGFGALAAAEARLSSTAVTDRRWKLTMRQTAALVVALLLLIAFAA